jgi:hypothetical protein
MNCESRATIALPETMTSFVYNWFETVACSDYKKQKSVVLEEKDKMQICTRVDKNRKDNNLY